MQRTNLWIGGVLLLFCLLTANQGFAQQDDVDPVLIDDTAQLRPAAPPPVLLNDTTPRAAIEIEERKNIQYGTGGGEPLLLDLAFPKGLTTAVPGLIWIHGGAWQGGNKTEFEKPIADAARQGFVAVSINYRLAPKHVFPAQIEDCKCAVRWLRANAEKLHVDPERIGVVGSSAGGHLAMLLGTTTKDDALEGEGGLPEVSSRVQAVVSLAGPTDLQSELPETSRGLVATFLGGPLSEKADAARRASPLVYVGANDAPMLLIHGTKDPLVPYEQAVGMAEALTQAGVPGRVELLLGEGHGWPDQHARVMRSAYEFLLRHLKQ